MREKTKEILLRAGKTFWQAAISELIAHFTILGEVLEGVPGWKSLLLSLGVGTVAAGLSAMWNGVLSPLLSNTAGKKKGEDSHAGH